MASPPPSRSRSQSLSIPPRLPSTTSAFNGQTPQTSEFQKAFQKHLRSTSMSGPHAVDTSSGGWASRVTGGGAGAGGEESHRPSSTTSTDSTESSSDSLPTPSSSPPNPAGTGLSGIGIGLGMFGVSAPGGTNRPKSINTTSIFESDEHEEAIEIEVGSPRSPSTTLFANGARWGWPQPSSSAISTSTSPPTSTFIGSPPSPPGSAIIGSVGRRAASVGSYGLTGVPLGRVVSNGQGGGVTMSTSQGSEGFGLFRKLSIGFGSKPKAPTPPPTSPVLSTPAPMLAQPSLVNEKPAPVKEAAREGRRASMGGGAKPKRRISPMGERMLRDFH